MTTNVPATGDIAPCEEFLNLIAQVEDALRKILDAKKMVPLSELAVTMTKRRPYLPFSRELPQLIQIRNLLIHNGGCNDSLLFPSNRSVNMLYQYFEALQRPRQAIDLFKKDVDIFQPDIPLSLLPKDLREKDYSQFPIVESKCILGVVTEHSITRYLARMAYNEICLSDIGEVAVREVIDNDQSRTHYQTIKANEEEDVLVGRFRETLTLEAVLITEDGTESSNLLGIATTWDIARLVSGKV